MSKVYISKIDRFLNNSIVIDPKFVQNRSDLYKQFLIFCKDHNITGDAIIQKNRFNDSIILKFGPSFKNSTIFYRGFKLKPII